MGGTVYRDASGRRRLYKSRWVERQTPTPEYRTEWVLDIGCSDRQRAEASLRYVSMDASGAGGPMLVGDCHHLPIRDSVVDVVFMFSLLEHVPDPPRAVAEAWRVLKPGGKLHVSVPFLNFYHDAVDYYRWTEDGLRMLLRNFCIERMERDVTGFLSVCLDWLRSGTYALPRPLAAVAQAVVRVLLAVTSRVDVARNRFYGYLTAEVVKPSR